MTMVAMIDCVAILHVCKASCVFNSRFQFLNFITFTQQVHERSNCPFGSCNKSILHNCKSIYCNNCNAGCIFDATILLIMGASRFYMKPSCVIVLRNVHKNLILF